MSDTDTAIHEAGHAVAHVRLSIQQAGVSIVRDGETLGRATAEGADSVWSAEQAADQVLAYCAGYAALIAFGRDADRAVQGADDDFDNAEGLIRAWSLPEGLADWQARAVAMMREPRNVAAVELVAEWLERERELDDDLIGVLVELADGSITRSDLEDYLAFRSAIASRQDGEAA